MNYYELLEIEVTATKTQIKTAYRKKAKEHHPDHGGDPEVFKSIQEAYECLMDDDEREFYDRIGAAKGSDIMNKVASIIREAITNPNPIKIITETLHSSRADCNIRIHQIDDRIIKLNKTLDSYGKQNATHKLYPVFVDVIKTEITLLGQQKQSYVDGLAEITQLELMFQGLKTEQEPTYQSFNFSSAHTDSKHLQDMLTYFNSKSRNSSST